MKRFAVLLGLALTAVFAFGQTSPSGYVFSYPTPSLTSSTGRISVQYSPGSALRYAIPFNDGAHDLVIDMGLYNTNQIFGFVQVGTWANTLGTPSTAFWQPVTVLQALSTDIVGPYQVMANANGDIGTEAWTGGGHNSTGNAGGKGVGVPTARMLSLSLWLDGVPLAADGIVRQGNRLDVRTVNRVQGYNTLTSKREILEEAQSYTITDAGCEIHCEITALEALTITRYYGLQASNVGLTSIHWPQGSPDTRVLLTSSGGTPNSGSITAAPNVRRFCLSGTSFNLVGWMDPNWGVGNMAYLYSTIYPSFVDGVAGKTYFNPIRLGAGTGLVLDPAGTATARWRGGLYFGADLGTSGADQTCLILNGGARQYVVDFLAAASGVYVPVLPEDQNKTVTLLSSYGGISVATRSTSKGVLVTAPGACSAQFQIGPNLALTPPPNGDTTQTPADPTGAASGAVMMGLKVAFAPVISSRAMVVITGQASNTTSGYGNVMTLRYGTGTAPNNGAAVTGTQLGASQTKVQGFALYTDCETFQGVLTGLVPGVTYWFDLSMGQVSGGTASIKNVTATVVEL